MKKNIADCFEVAKFNKVVREELSEGVLEKREKVSHSDQCWGPFPAEGRASKGKGPEAGEN